MICCNPEVVKVLGAKRSEDTWSAEKTKIDLENNGWMVGFAPYENPEIAVVVYIPNGYGGARVSPAMIEIMQYYLDQRDITVNETMPASNWLAY